MELSKVFRDKLYGGFLGKVIGVIHGANTEGWSRQRIQRAFGEITQYPFRFKNFCSDDDVNGPIFYMRVLKDFPDTSATADTMAHTLLNYVADGHGFFWWGGYGISTEHTAYENLQNGVSALESGSLELNGKTVAEQIGGQIFSDCWGLLCPEDPAQAAELAEKMSSVTHGGDGIQGGRFIAACIAKAYKAADVDEILDAGLGALQEGSGYARMAADVRAYCERIGGNWEEAFAYVEEKYGYRHYEGVCHIIPNAAVIVLSLVCGAGDFSRTINIANMCGWDTDCNAGNLGAILGVFAGASGIEEKWLGQVNDFICASGVLGCLNIQTVSQAADLAASLTHRLYKKEPDEVYRKTFAQKEGNYIHFEYPNSTGAFRCRGHCAVCLWNVEGEAHFGTRSLKISALQVENGDCFQIYRKTYYRPEDFDDSRYDPDFSPIVYPGDTIGAWVMVQEPLDADIRLIPFVKERVSGACIRLEAFAVSAQIGSWQEISFEIPRLDNAILEETGLEFVCRQVGQRETRHPVICRLDEWTVSQHPHTRMEFGVLPVEQWNALHQFPAHLTYLRGIVCLQEGALHISGSGRPAESYTGSLNWEDYQFRAALTPGRGKCHSLLFRVQGAMRSYLVSFEENERLVLRKRYGKEAILCEAAYDWKLHREYEVLICAQGKRLRVSVNGELQMEVVDEKPYLNGCIGFGSRQGARTAFRYYEINEIRRNADDE